MQHDVLTPGPRAYPLTTLADPHPHLTFTLALTRTLTLTLALTLAPNLTP